MSVSGRTSGTMLTLILKCFSNLSNAFASVRENLHSFHQKEKDRYVLGAIERVFKPGDQVRIRLKSRQKGNSKFLSKRSSPHEVLQVRGVVVTVRELSTGRKYNTHHNRLSNPLFSGKKGEPELELEHEPNTNPEKNLKEPEKDAEPVGDPEEALMRTRSGRVVRHRRNKDLYYTRVLFHSGLCNTSKITCFLDGSHSSTSFY